jgi:hypothetical protein
VRTRSPSRCCPPTTTSFPRRGPWLGCSESSSCRHLTGHLRSRLFHLSPSARRQHHRRRLRAVVSPPTRRGSTSETRSRVDRRYVVARIPYLVGSRDCDRSTDDANQARPRFEVGLGALGPPCVSGSKLCGGAFRWHEHSPAAQSGRRQGSHNEPQKTRDGIAAQAASNLSQSRPDDPTLGWVWVVADRPGRQVIKFDGTVTGLR